MPSCSHCGTELGRGANGGAHPESGVPALGSVFGSYRLLALIAQGGMGRVYLAEHTRLGRKVALKMLRSEYANNPVALRRFFDEARAVNRIAHDNIVEITDFVENEDGHSYYIMELLRGQTLFALRDREGVLPLERTLAIAVQVADALAVVHEAGIVHRDLKPENIFLIERGGQPDFVKLLDFGVAKLIEPDRIRGDRTAAGTVLGTPEYMSPEQAAGEEIDHRTDIYALGIILYEMVTGEHPFEADSFAELLVRQMATQPTRPSELRRLPFELPPELEDLILQCLEKEAEARPHSMREVEIQLRSFANLVACQPARFATVGMSRLRRPRRALIRAATIGAVVVSCLLGGALMSALLLGH